MRAGLAYAVIGTLLLAGGWEAVQGIAGETGGGEAQAGERGAQTETTAISPERHEKARFLVRGDDDAYRVNVRYVGLIGESVIAIRQGAGDAGEQWVAIELDDMPRAPSSLPFGADAWRSFALGLAERVRLQQDICPEGQTMRLLRDGGEVRTMYRKRREAWVVFAACPGASQG